ncbi:MAG: hypothetical protein R3B90_10135 [Planctomycetaceae bacterium]
MSSQGVANLQFVATAEEDDVVALSPGLERSSRLEAFPYGRQGQAHCHPVVERARFFWKFPVIRPTKCGGGV